MHSESKLTSAVIVVGAGAIAFLTWLGLTFGYVVSLPLYAWVLFGRGASVLRGAWPGTFMMEDLETDRGIKILFSCLLGIHTAGVVLWRVVGG